MTKGKCIDPQCTLVHVKGTWSIERTKKPPNTPKKCLGEQAQKEKENDSQPNFTKESFLEMVHLLKKELKEDMDKQITTLLASQLHYSHHHQLTPPQQPMNNQVVGAPAHYPLPYHPHLPHQHQLLQQQYQPILPPQPQNLETTVHHQQKLLFQQWLHKPARDLTQLPAH